MDRAARPAEGRKRGVEETRFQVEPVVPGRRARRAPVIAGARVVRAQPKVRLVVPVVRAERAARAE